MEKLEDLSEASIFKHRVLMLEKIQLISFRHSAGMRKRVSTQKTSILSTDARISARFHD